MAGEVDADGQPGAEVGDRLDKDVDGRPDRPVSAAEPDGMRGALAGPHAQLGHQHDPAADGAAFQHFVRPGDVGQRERRLSRCAQGAGLE